MTFKDALADVKTEGENPFEMFNTETETPSESPAEKEPEADKPVEGDDKEDAPIDNTPEEDTGPFHKHPRWIERENELKSLREEKEAMARDLDELKSFRDEANEKFSRVADVDDDIPEWFSTLYGENKEAWKAYQVHEQEREVELEKKILSRQEQQHQQEQEEAKRWNTWVDDNIKKLEESGKKFDRNELVKTMLEFRPTDNDNNLDFEAGYKIYEAVKGRKEPEAPAKSQARKALADTTTKVSGGDKKQKDYMTPKDLRNMSWHSL